MTVWKTMFAMLLAVGVSMTLAGCGGGEETAPADGEEAAMADGHADDHEDGEHTHAEGEEHAHEGEEEDEEADEARRIEENMAKLSEEDRELAMAQKICPVGGELGSMGTPMKVDVEGRTVFICCEGCEKPLLEDPAKYLAKLDAPEEAEEAVE